MFMDHTPHIFVTCWKCGKDFDITEAEKCYEHLNGNQEQTQMALALGESHFTTKCSHCGACICYKVSKMVPTDCKILNQKGIKFVMPSLAKQLKKSKSDLGVGH